MESRMKPWFLCFVSQPISSLKGKKSFLNIITYYTKCQWRTISNQVDRSDLPTLISNEKLRNYCIGNPNSARARAYQKYIYKMFSSTFSMKHFLIVNMYPYLYVHNVKVRKVLSPFWIPSLHGNSLIA